MISHQYLLCLLALLDFWKMTNIVGGLLSFHFKAILNPFERSQNSQGLIASFLVLLRSNFDLSGVLK